MGGAANIFEWIVPPIAIAHETFAAVGRAAGAGEDFLAAPGSRFARPAASRVQATGVKPTPTKPFMTDAERKKDARLAAARRKKDYQDMGRSSTILTSPGGLGGSGPGEQKTLLGM